jgi:tetratricopeptide (TPR) repeat protein
MDEAAAAGERAKDLDPFSPLADINLIRIFYYARQYDKAGEYLTKFLKEDPNNFRAMYLSGLIQLQKGNYPDAITIFENLYAKNKLRACAALGYTYGKTNRKTDAIRMLNELETQIAKNDYTPSLEKAYIYIGLGDRDSAFFFLEKAYSEHFYPLAGIKMEPLFDDLRTDPRFQALLQKMNL